MFTFAVVVFREVLEVALVLGTVLAGTRGLAQRSRWIWSGLIAGLVGPGIVALFTETISDSLEGFGQEVFNASILLFAAVLIGGTVIWMKGHAKQLTKHLRAVASEVSCGKKPLSVLATVIALTVLRDGSETVLLAQGIFLANQNVAALVVGGMLGLVAGVAVGIAIYYSLIRSATRYIFEVTSWLLIALCAGMVSQGVGLLAAADVIPAIASPLWDTSAILSDQSFLGQTFHLVLGYTARPAGIQVICYMLTLVVIVVGVRRMGQDQTLMPRMRPEAFALAILLALSCLLLPKQVFAVDKIYSPIVEQGELELETRGSYSFDSDNEKDDDYKQKFGVGYGFTDRFAAEALATIAQAPQDSLEFDSVGIETRYQLFDQGEYWLDWGLYLEYELETESEEHFLEGKLLVEKSTESWVHTTNLILEREVFAQGGEPWEGEVRWQSLYRYDESLEPGIEIQSELGDLDDLGSFDEQEHFVGPALHGKSGHVKYELAGLFGVSEEAPDFTLRWVLEYEL